MQNENKTIVIFIQAIKLVKRMKYKQYKQYINKIIY